ncbi:MAG: hypothetical protein WAO01_00040, partial [Bradyrhizobium sp.]
LFLGNSRSLATTMRGNPIAGPAELFARLAEHFRVLLGEIEKTNETRSLDFFRAGSSVELVPPPKATGNTRGIRQPNRSCCGGEEGPPLQLVQHR